MSFFDTGENTLKIGEVAIVFFSTNATKTAYFSVKQEGFSWTNEAIIIDLTKVINIATINTPLSFLILQSIQTLSVLTRLFDRLISLFVVDLLLLLVHHFLENIERLGHQIILIFSAFEFQLLKSMLFLYFFGLTPQIFDLLHIKRQILLASCWIKPLH